MAASTRKNPLLWGRENIFVTQHGIAHAIYALTGLPYGFALKEDKIAARAAHQSLYQRLHGEYTIYSLIADTDPLSIIKSMTEGIHLPDYPGWVNETKLTMEKLENSPSGERMFFITFPLSTWSQPVNRVRDSVWAAHQPVQSHLGLPVVPPSDEMFGRWKRRARELSMRIPVAFNPVPVSMKAVQWIWDHAQMRGIGTEDPYPMDARITAENRADGWVNLRSLPEPLLDEGGMSDVDGVSGRVEAFKRRYVKVEHPLGAPTYQTQMIMSATPVGGFVFPGGEFLEAVNKLPVDCEFVLRVKVQSKHKANQDSARSESNIEDQLFQQDGSGNRISGGLSQLAQASKLLEEFVESLNASEREVKVSASMIFSVSGPTPELVEAQANEVQTFFGGSEFVLDAPVGDQRRLWWDMLPGTMASSITNELTQITTGYDFSIGVPLVETQLGENHGFLIGENLSSGRNTPVFMSPGGNAEANRSGSFGAVGDLGSGKSAFLKTVAAHTINRGGQVIAVDNSENQEWAKLAKAMTEVVVLDFENPQYSLDPIRNSDSPEEAAQQVMDLLSMLFGLNAFTPVGAAIDSVLNPETNPDFEKITSMSKLRDALEEGRGVPDNLIEGAQEAAVKLAILSRKRHMRYLFDDSLPVLDLDAPAIIFATHGMDLPSENDLSTAEMRAQMTLTKKIGYATYGHIAAISYQLATHDDSRESIFIVDEAAHLTASPEACHRVEQFISRGRKHKAAIGLGSHSALDFGSAKLRSLILHRFLFRTADQDLANVNLSWLQKGYDTAEYRDLLAGLSPDEEEERRGECIYRDVQSRIGKIKIQLPLDPKTRQATLTTPPSTRKKKQQAFADRSLVEA